MGVEFKYKIGGQDNMLNMCLWLIEDYYLLQKDYLKQKKAIYYQHKTMNKHFQLWEGQIKEYTKVMVIKSSICKKIINPSKKFSSDSLGE